MECEKSICPVLKIDGVLATGKQFDLDITLPEDNRSVIYGVVKDCCHDPICNAVVKLVEVDDDCGKEERRPVSHTFTDENGEVKLQGQGKVIEYLKARPELYEDLATRLIELCSE